LAKQKKKRKREKEKETTPESPSNPDLPRRPAYMPTDLLFLIPLLNRLMIKTTRLGSRPLPRSWHSEEVFLCRDTADEGRALAIGGCLFLSFGLPSSQVLLFLLFLLFPYLAMLHF
jgi:hypothetical protein